MTQRNDNMLDDLLNHTKGVAPAPSDDLFARVLADAVVLQPKPSAIAPVATPRTAWDLFMDVIGGWPAFSSLAAATIAGVWIGVAPPAVIDDLTASYLGDELSISLDTADMLLIEGGIIDG
ncbi:MAG: hypothetical protein AAGF56_02100 [Pseudomonadota bacterium]